MSVTIVAALDAVATAIVHLRLCDRAAVVEDTGVVHALVTQAAERAPHADATRLPGGLAAYLCTDVIDAVTWLHADLGSFRLVARLRDEVAPATALASVSAELRAIGVVVEHAPDHAR